jgi:inorganic phosphate transporter, PiT family
MSQAAVTPDQAPRGGGYPHLDTKPHFAGAIIFIVVLLGALAYTAASVMGDIRGVGGAPVATGAFVLLGLALLIALGFEFVNGFHDTANAVATVIYTHSLPPNVAVVWSGFFNFLGVLTSSGAVAFGVLSLLPVELILQVGSGAGYAMIFALLLAAIIWNLGTWALGLPASSSHTLIGSIIGVGLANQFLAPAGDATSGVEWSQASSVFKALLLSPVVGFVCAALLLLAMKAVVRSRALYTAPEGQQPPPLWIRSLLVLTCTGVSFAHGSNDGQKGMGLIMLILIGAAPTAYALNRAMPDSAMPAFVEASAKAGDVLRAHAEGRPVPPAEEGRKQVEAAIRDHAPNRPETYAALAALAADIVRQVQSYGTMSQVPAAATGSTRNDMYLASEAVRLLERQKALPEGEAKTLGTWRSQLDAATKFIPTWVKIAVAVALGLGTMVGWKRIVVTVGERIGKTHLTYGQGASAELVAALTIGAADAYGLPVSTTHVLSSGVAGTMAANGSGLQWATVRSIAMAWVLTMPAAMILSGALYTVFRQIF